MPLNLPPKIVEQIKKAGLPTGGQCAFEPNLATNLHGEPVIKKRAILKGPKQGKRGYLDTQGRIWIKDRAHAGLPDHWDVQIRDGDEYIRVDLDGNVITT